MPMTSVANAAANAAPATNGAVRRDGAPPGAAMRGYAFVANVNKSATEMMVSAEPEDVAKLERAFDADPVLKAAEREILSTSEAQARAQAERAELLMRGREYDAMLGKLGHHFGSYGDLASAAAPTFTRLSGSDDDDKASTQSVAYLSSLDVRSTRSYSPFDSVLDDSAENLLCEFGAPMMDAGIGMMDDEGNEVLVEHNAPPLSSWMSNGNLCALDAPDGHQPEWASGGGASYRVPEVVEFGVPGHTEVESIASLRAQYRALFGKDTNSNNRQWIMRRLEAFRNGDEFTPPTSRFGSPLSEEDTMGHVGASRFKPSVASPKRAVGKRQVNNGREEDYVEEHESPTRRGAAAKAAAAAKGKTLAKGKRGAEAVLPKSAGKKAKSVSDAESIDGDVGKKPNARNAASKAAAGRGKPGENGTGRRSKHHNPWALEEAEALVRGVAQCGGGKWADIKKLGFPAIEHRTAVDLKDKWRNLLRIAMLPQQSVKTVGDKKREIPQELLAKVRELAAKQAKAKAAAEARRAAGN